MKIKEIKSQNRRDFTGIYICEHCNHEQTGSGYDDSYYHQYVIPKIRCEKCGEISPNSYRPLTPKYSDGDTV